MLDKQVFSRAEINQFCFEIPTLIPGRTVGQAAGKHLKESKKGWAVREKKTEGSNPEDKTVNSLGRKQRAYGPVCW